MVYGRFGPKTLRTQLMITGYDIFCNLQGRGSVLYVKASLQSLTSKMHTEVDASVWCSVKLHNNDSLLVGSVYSSSSSSSSVPARHLARFFFIFIIALRIGAETITTV